MKTQVTIKTLRFLTSLISLLFCVLSVKGQEHVSADSIKTSRHPPDPRFAGRSLRMTSLTFGGNGLYLTKVNGKFSVFSGGRGSATFNDRFTIGGGGWGMTKGVALESEAGEAYNFVRLGYGGVDFGFVFHPGKKIDTGLKVLIAGGALFKETVPESGNKDFRLFPAFEPSAYYQLHISSLFRLEMGAGYRYIPGVKLPYISSSDLSGVSCYIGFLVSTGGGKE